MRVIDYSFKRPQDNLAYDEILLDNLESKKVDETLRFWESGRPFVVLGVSQALREEVFEIHCREDKVPIQRRCSAGGCVLQGQGCLNFTLTLSHAKHPEIRTIRDSYCYVLGNIAKAFNAHGVPARHKGTSDLAIGGKKISGNSQRRRKKAILHHGTILYEPNVDGMERYLKEPADRPQYRGPRTHRGFVDQVRMTPDVIRKVLCEAFGLDGQVSKPEKWELHAARDLGTDKYAAHAWVYRR